MKGNEIIKNIIREEMPDIEQVRMKCLNQEADKISTEHSRNKKRPVGKTVLVAIIILSLMSTAVLATVLSGIVQIGTPYWENDRVGVETAGVYPISENLRKYIINPDSWEQQLWGENDEYQQSHIPAVNLPVLSSMDEAADFYGIPFPKNPMLNEYLPSDRVDLEGHTNIPEEYLVNSTVHYNENEESETANIFLFATNKLDTGDRIGIIYQFICGTNTDATASTSPMYIKSGANIAVGEIISAEDLVKIDDEERNDIQNYISPVNNIEAILYTVWHDDNNPIYSYYAIFAVNGIAYNMSVYPNDIDSKYYNNPYDTLKAVIDAYIFE